MPTSFRPGCIAFAGQAHAQGRVSLQKHVSLRRTGMPRRGFPAVGRTARAPTHRCLQCLCIARLSPATELQRICSLGTRPLSCVPRCSQERPAPTLHFRRRRLQVWLHRCCNQGVTGLTIRLPQPASFEKTWLIAASFSSECPYTHVPVTIRVPKPCLQAPPAGVA